MSRTHLLWLWLAYLGFVVYGSLVPLEPNARTLEDALSMFRSIRLLDVGTQGRADWIANGVLYLPLGFLTATLLTRSDEDRPSVVAFLAAVVFGVALAIGVEFLQLFFPPRTVSLNDLVAESIGTVAGASLALQGLSRFRGLLAALLGDPARLNAQILSAYLLLYAALAAFPYDFVVSWGEFATKLASGHAGLLLAQSADDAVLRMFAKMLAEVVATIPVGILLASDRRFHGRGGFIRAMLTGALVGVLIECVQLLLVSGVSQGLSVMTRAGGAALGFYVAAEVGAARLLALVHMLRRYSALFVALYLLALAGLNDWFSREWLGWLNAQAVFADLRFLPFYYHYYTTEQAALLSLIAVAAMYAPVGLLGWANGFTAMGAAALAAMACGTIETSKLFLADLHPDPTNVLLGASSAAAVYLLVERMARSARRVDQSSVGATSLPAAEVASGREGRAAAGRGEHGHETPGTQADARPASTSATAHLLLALATLGLAWFGWQFPFHGSALAGGMLAYAAVIWRRPEWSAAAIPLGLVTLDLAPRSGWYFVDEFDLMLLVSVAVVTARLPAPPKPPRRRYGLTALLSALIAATFLIGAVRGLLPMAVSGIDVASYHSPLNALRLAKGALWTFVLLSLFSRLSAAGFDAARLFLRGILCGLVVVVAVVIWERAAFPGMFALDDVYRVTGPFSQMHVGGSDLETYLAVAAPVLTVAILSARNLTLKALGILLFVASTYCVMVSFSRAAYVAYGFGVMLALASQLRPAMGRVRGLAQTGRIALAAALVILGLGVAATILSGPFARDRFASVSADLETRMVHWEDALQIRDGDWATSLFGMGIGRYPATHYWRSGETRAAAFALGKEGEDPYLRLAPGMPLYIDQFVALAPGRQYPIELRLRSAEAGSRVVVSLCEKWLITSARCAETGFETAQGGAWQTFEATLAADEVGGGKALLGRTVKLSIHHAGGKAAVDVDEIRLIDAEGANLLANGDFSQGMGRWFFSADNDLPWHIWSLPVGLLFDQGWFGVIAVGLLLTCALWRAALSTRRGAVGSGALFGALSGIVVLGAVNTMIDSPRVLLLVLTLAFLALRRGRLEGLSAAVRTNGAGQNRQASPAADSSAPP